MVVRGEARNTLAVPRFTLRHGSQGEAGQAIVNGLGQSSLVHWFSVVGDLHHVEA